MASVNTYLNFNGNAEEAFNYYKSIFGGEFVGGLGRFRDMPPIEHMPPIPENLKNKVMHVALKIVGGHILMGSDAPAEMGFNLIKGNNVHIYLNMDTRQQAESLLEILSNGGQIEHELQQMFWGAYFGNLTDKFGIRWMFSCNNN